MKEDLDGAEHLYETWLEQVNSTQIAKAVESADVANPMVLIENARIPLQPFAPKKKPILALALGMGLVLGLGAAVVSEYFDLTLVTTEEVESVLGVPILGAVPRMQATVLLESAARQRTRLRLVIAAATLAVLALAFAGYWFFAGPAAR
jgi:capsular polysaccharide biosynthesis protein